MTRPIELPGRPTGWTTLQVLFLANGAFTATIAPFAPVILRDRGLDTAMIGILLAFASLVGTLITPAWGHAGDIVMGRARAFQVGIVLAGAAAAGLLLPLPIGLITLLVASFTIFISLFLALGDALAVDVIGAIGSRYGALRALASLSFAIGVVGAGVLYDRSGYAAAPIVALAASVVLFVLAAVVPDTTRDPAVRRVAAAHGGPAAAGRFGSVSRVLAIEPRLIGLMAALTVAFAGVEGAVTFVAVRIADLGGRPSDVALSFGLAALTEIPGLLVTGWLARRFGLGAVFLVALGLHGVLIAAWGILPTPDAINLTRLLTGVFFGTLLAARVLVVARLLPLELQGTGQTLVSAIAFGLGTVLGDVLGGVVYAAFGATAFFGLAGAMALAGGIGAWLIVRSTERPPDLSRPRRRPSSGLPAVRRAPWRSRPRTMARGRPPR